MPSPLRAMWSQSLLPCGIHFVRDRSQWGAHVGTPQIFHWIGPHRKFCRKMLGYDLQPEIFEHLPGTCWAIDPANIKTHAIQHPKDLGEISGTFPRMATVYLVLLQEENWKQLQRS